MKKLLILSAMAMSAGAIFADSLASEDFEEMTAGTGYSGSNIADLGDNWGTTSTETEATVTAYASGDNKNYLALSTQTASLDFYHDTLKTKASVAESAIYFDSYVQFTPTPLTWDEVGDTTKADMAEGDKIAVWLANIAESNDKAAATKLMITAGKDDNSGSLPKANYMATTVVEAGNWYRLTIAAKKGTFNGSNDVTVFDVYVDGTLVSAVESNTEDAAINKFYSCVASGDEKMTIKNVGFKGTGAVDDLVWTLDDPFAVAGAEFAIGTKQYTTFAKALAEAESGATIKMIANSGTDIVVTEGKNVTLDLNAYTLSAGISNAGTLTIVNTDPDHFATVTGNVVNTGSLTIGEDEFASGMIKFTGASVSATTIKDGYYTNKPTGSAPDGLYIVGPATLNEILGGGYDDDETSYYYVSNEEPEPGEDPVIDPAAATISVKVAAESDKAAIAAVKKAIVVPTGASESVTQAEYAEYFDYSAKEGSTEGTFEVAITGIKEDKIAQVENAALEALQGDGSTITVLPGLYYGFAAGAAPTGLTVSALDLATGTTMNIVKPESTDKGFLKVVVSPKPTLDSAK